MAQFRASEGAADLFGVHRCIRVNASRGKKSQRTIYKAHESLHAKMETAWNRTESIACCALGLGVLSYISYLKVN